MTTIYKCENCGFECMSEKLMLEHKTREDSGLTEYEEKQKIRKEQKEKANSYLVGKDSGN